MFSRRAKKEDEELVEEEEGEKKPRAPRKPREEKKDPTRWLSIVFFFLFLFVSYLFWMQR